jgi:ribonuclease Z
MEHFELHILGCGSALPSKRNNQTSQILTMRNKSFMIDCGEGAQIQIRRLNISTARLNHIFISHLHGDHIFGLIGLISTFGMQARTAELCIHAPEELETLLRPMLDFCCKDLTFKITFIPHNPRKHALIYEDRTVEVHSIPLDHRVPCCGFLFREKPKQRHLRKDMIDFCQIPIKDLARIKNGEDFITADGEIIKNERLTTAPTPSKSYAYCSDTAYSEKIIPIIEGVDCLFHEATYLSTHLARSKETKHSTAAQAAEIARKAKVKKLVIGHFSARYDDQKPLLEEAAGIFPNTVLGEDGLKILV